MHFFLAVLFLSLHLSLLSVQWANWRDSIGRELELQHSEYPRHTHNYVIMIGVVFFSCAFAIATVSGGAMRIDVSIDRDEVGEHLQHQRQHFIAVRMDDVDDSTVDRHLGLSGDLSALFTCANKEISPFTLIFGVRQDVNASRDNNALLCAVPTFSDEVLYEPHSGAVRGSVRESLRKNRPIVPPPEVHRFTATFFLPSKIVEQLTVFEFSQFRSRNSTFDVFIMADDTTQKIDLKFARKIGGNFFATEQDSKPQPQSTSSSRSKRRSFGALAAVDLDLRLYHLRPLQACGPIETQLNVVFVSSGYTEDMIDAYTKNVSDIAEMMISTVLLEDLAETIGLFRLLSHANIFGIFVPSPEVGASNLAIGVKRDTSLQCSIYESLAPHEGRLQCDVSLAAAFADATEADTVNYKESTLIIALVNTPVRAAQGMPRPFKTITISSNFNLRETDDRRKFWNAFSHAMGHAMYSLADEYDRGESERSVVQFPNCVAPREPIPWQAYIVQQRIKPWDNLRSSNASLAIDDQPSTPCGFSNYLRPSSNCVMGLAQLSPDEGHYCVVCRSVSLLSTYEILSRKREITSPVHVEDVPFLLWPRCPMLQEIAIVAVGERLWLHTNRRTTPSNGFITRWSLKGVILAENVTSVELSVVHMVEIAQSSSFDVVLTVTDFGSQLWILPSQVPPLMRVQETNYSVQAVSNPQEYSGWTVKQCRNPLFATAMGQYRALCREPNACAYAYQTQETVTTIGGLPQQRSVALVAAVFAAIVLIAVPWVYISYRYFFIEMKYIPRDVHRLHMKLPFSTFESFASQAVSAFGTAMLIGACAGFLTGLKLYVLTVSLTNVTLGIVILMALAANVTAFLSFRGSLLRETLPTKVSGVIVIIFCVLVVVLVLAVAKLDSYLADSDGSAMKELEAIWKEEVRDSPYAVCQTQSQLSCSGWGQSCPMLNSSTMCPAGCAANSLMNTPCSVVFTQVVMAKFKFALNICIGMVPFLLIFAMLHFSAAKAFKRVRDEAEATRQRPFGQSSGLQEMEMSLVRKNNVEKDDAESKEEKVATSSSTHAAPRVNPLDHPSTMSSSPPPQPRKKEPPTFIL